MAAFGGCAGFKKRRHKAKVQKPCRNVFVSAIHLGRLQRRWATLTQKKDEFLSSVQPLYYLWMYKSIVKQNVLHKIKNTVAKNTKKQLIMRYKY